MYEGGDMMNIQNYMNNMYVSNLFTNNNTSNTHTNFIYQANAYNTLSKYAITAKYADTSTSTNNNSTSIGSNTTASATSFLSKLDTTYSDLDKAINKLKDSLQNEESDIITAAQEYVNAYNNTTKFLEEHSSSTTSRLNRLKFSHSAASNVGMADLASIGITKNNDGTLNLNTDKLNTALSNNNTSATRTLNNLVNRSEASIKMATNASKSQLVHEQNKVLAHSSTIDDNDITYENFLSLSKNPTALNNYYHSLSTLGIFMDFSI